MQSEQHKHNAMLQLRPYQSSDADSVSCIIRTTMRISNSGDYPLERLQPLLDYFSPAKVEQINRTRTCLVAEENGQILATAGLEGNEVVTCFVLPEHQGRGIGSALLQNLEILALAQGISELKLDASITGAPFYERRGYRRTGAILDGVAGPQVSMRKPLR